MAPPTHIFITNLSLDARQPYGGQIDYTHLNLREAAEEEATSLSPSSPNSTVLYKSYINSGLHLPITPLIRGILAWFDISPSQVNANFYRAISVASAAIPHLRKDLVLTPELFLNCYKLGRKRKDTVLGKLFLVPRFKNVAAPGGRLPTSDKSWQLCPFVAMGRWLESEGAKIRSAPNRNVDFKKPPPPLSSKDAVAFTMLQGGDNRKFEKFLKTAHIRKKITARASSSRLPRNVTKAKKDDSIMKPIRNHESGDIPSSSKQNPSKKMNVIELDSSTSSDDEFLCRLISTPKFQQKQTMPATDISGAMNLIETGAKRLREAQEEVRTAKGLKEENDHLKAEMEGLKKQCFELDAKIKSDAQIATCLLTEKDELSRRLEATISEREPVSARQKELESQLEKSGELLTICQATIKTLQEIISNAQRSLKLSDVSQACSSGRQ